MIILFLINIFVWSGCFMVARKASKYNIFVMQPSYTLWHPLVKIWLHFCCWCKSLNLQSFFNVGSVSVALFFISFYNFRQLLFHQCLLFGEGSRRGHTTPGPLNHLPLHCNRMGLSVDALNIFFKVLRYLFGPFHVKIN